MVDLAYTSRGFQFFFQSIDDFPMQSCAEAIGFLGKKGESISKHLGFTKDKVAYWSQRFFEAMPLMLLMAYSPHLSTGVTLGLGTLCFIKISTSSCLAKQRADSLKVLANCANAVALYSLSSSLVKIIQAIHARHYLNVAKYSLGLYLSVKLGGIGELIYTTAHSFAEKKRMIMLPKYLKRKNLFNRNDIEKPKDPRHPLNCKVLKRGMININTYVHNKQFKSLITKVTKLIGTILPSKNKQSRSVTDLLSSCKLIYNEDEVRPKKKQAKRAQDAISVWLSGSYYKFIDESVKLRQRLCGTDSLESM